MENASLLKAIVQNAAEAIITIDGYGMIALINPCACCLFGYKGAEIVGKNIAMLMPPFEWHHSGCINGISKGREIKGLKKDGTIFPCRLELNEVYYGGKTIYTGFIRDLSREKKDKDQLNAYAAQLESLVKERTQSLKGTAKALRKAKAELTVSLAREIEIGLSKDRFIAMASHEFRTPLTLVALSTYLIDKYATPLNDPNIGKHTCNIKDAVNNITLTLNDFLTLGKIEAGKTQPDIN